VYSVITFGLLLLCCKLTVIDWVQSQIVEIHSKQQSHTWDEERGGEGRAGQGKAGKGRRVREGEFIPPSANNGSATGLK